MKTFAVLVALLLSSVAAMAAASIPSQAGSHSAQFFAPAEAAVPGNNSEPCSSEGAKRNCLAESDCYGRQACRSGLWSACGKADMCCAVNCDDGNESTADSCDRGVCRYAGIGKASSGKLPGSQSGQPSREWSAQDIEAALAELPPGPEVEALRALVADAKRLSLEGKAEESQAAWEQIGLRLDALLSKARYSELQSLGFAVSMVLVIIILAAYAAVNYRKRKAQDRSAVQEKAQARHKQIESEKAELAKRFMKREIDYESYTGLVEALNSESIRQKNRLSERK